MSTKLNAEIRALRAELAALRQQVVEMQVGRVPREVRVAVQGPRRAGVFVESRAIELVGHGVLAGRRPIIMESPTVDVVLATKGPIGTRVAFEIEINGKKKQEEFWSRSETESRSFEYSFADFGL